VLAAELGRRRHLGRHPTAFLLGLAPEERQIAAMSLGRIVVLLACAGCATPETSAPALASEEADVTAAASTAAAPAMSVAVAVSAAASAPPATATTAVASAAPSASASAKASKRRCELPEPDPPRRAPGASGAAVQVFDWLAVDGGCAVPKAYRPWSWSMLRRVSGLRKNAVVLTVDGGHNIEVTRAGLEVLADYGVHATYFLTTSELQKQGARGAELVQRIATEGHEIANHSATHPHLTKLDDKKVRAEIQDADDWLAEVLGYSPRPFFRPPFLDHDKRVGKILEELCYRPVWFTVYSRDDEPRISADDIAEAVLCAEDGGPRKFDRGSILMFHASQKETVKAWPVILTALRQRKIDVLPLGEAMREAAESKAKRRASK
jgi:peptidoglycan/xylan/chitin deacetylase (PgdA/CDA1 family)